MANMSLSNIILHRQRWTYKSHWSVFTRNFKVKCIVKISLIHDYQRQTFIQALWIKWGTWWTIFMVLLFLYQLYIKEPWFTYITCLQGVPKRCSHYPGICLKMGHFFWDTLYNCTAQFVLCMCKTDWVIKIFSLPHRNSCTSDSLGGAQKCILCFLRK